MPPRRIPSRNRLPHLGQVDINWRGHTLSLPYFYRASSSGPAVLFVHGLGGAKENFYAAFQSSALADCALLAFDLPGTGLAEFLPQADMDVSGLADLTYGVADRLLPNPYWIAGASMGGLIELLLIRKHGTHRIQGLINLEGNLCPEDCMFSRRVVPHALDAFGPLYEQLIDELRASTFPGDQIIAHNMAMNVDIRAYHAYSFQTVKESDAGSLLTEFLDVPLPKLFLYGEQNCTLSYLPRLRDSAVNVVEIPKSAHFFFYDNPEATFEAIGNFVYTAGGSTRVTVGLKHTAGPPRKSVKTDLPIAK